MVFLSFSVLLASWLVVGGQAASSLGQIHHDGGPKAQTKDRAADKKEAEAMVTKLESIQHKLEANMKRTKALNKDTSEGLSDIMSSNRMDKHTKDQFGKILKSDRRSFDRLRASNNMVVSKIKNAVHFLKRGVAEGDVAEGLHRARQTLQEFANQFIW
ncbi:unnamed protein product [Vitrella brassicaformis CCMP3155]|uniref:RxLR effector protein n=1 Tax=Vitrella brassicaformis (strain CCMP3155) TaxID=1169540 RepID=A0A0G4FH22_VITBC|nr:unnamed protein product [Vitrella brassicaformis CCMP3155]|eukprot:CEM12156.1 unnamed protein product [Vitrella brassicaformis CCMP3155]